MSRSARSLPSPRSRPALPRASRNAAIADLVRSVNRLSDALAPLARAGALQRVGLSDGGPDAAPEQLSAATARTAAAVLGAAELLPLARHRPVVRQLAELAQAEPRLRDALSGLQESAGNAARSCVFTEHGVQPIDVLYEKMLDALDRPVRRSCGVYFTPAPITRYIVDAVHTLLQQELELPDGLADTTSWGELCERDGRIRLPAGVKPRDPFVQVLDPACGTGAFLVAAIERMHQQVKERSRLQGRGARASAAHWSRFVRDHVLPRVHGLDILSAPCALARMAIESKLRETGYEPRASDVIAVRRADALEPSIWAEPGMRWPATVILGNPPFAGAAPASSGWMEALMLDYKRSVRLRERQLQRLSNQYVRFLRLAEWKVRAAGIGVVGLITDRGWLDGLLFGDVRQSLLGMAQRVHVVDLGGGSARRPAQADDANVFEIRQPVAIACGVLRDDASGGAGVRTAIVRGSRAEKLAWLDGHGLEARAFGRSQATSPIRIGRSQGEYLRWPSLLDILGAGDHERDRALWYGTGFKTRHDRFVIGMTPEHAVELIRRLAHRREPDAVLRRELGLCSTVHFNLAEARAVAEQPLRSLRALVRRVSFRPMDFRWVVWSRAFVCEPKMRTLRHLLHDQNLCLAVLRRDRSGLACGALAARGLVAKDLVSNVDDALIWPMLVETDDGLQPNVQPRFLDALDARTGCGSVEPDQIVGYLYAVLWSPHYRQAFRTERCADFPRIPLPRTSAAFFELASIGSRLCRTHLLEAEPAGKRVGRLSPGTLVQEVRYDREAQRAYVQPGVWVQVSAEAWDHVVGVHQVCAAWLKARRGRALDEHDIRHLLRVIEATESAATTASSIDACIERHGGWSGAFSAAPGLSPARGSRPQPPGR